MAITWDVGDNLNAEALGWGLFDTGSDGHPHFEIQGIDDPERGYPPEFESDADALDYVIARAADGSDLHARALAIHRQYNPS